MQKLLDEANAKIAALSKERDALKEELDALKKKMRDMVPKSELDALKDKSEPRTFGGWVHSFGIRSLRRLRVELSCVEGLFCLGSSSGWTRVHVCKCVVVFGLDADLPSAAGAGWTRRWRKQTRTNGTRRATQVPITVCRRFHNAMSSTDQVCLVLPEASSALEKLLVSTFYLPRRAICDARC